MSEKNWGQPLEDLAGMLGADEALASGEVHEIQSSSDDEAGEDATLIDLSEGPVVCGKFVLGSGVVHDGSRFEHLEIRQAEYGASQSVSYLDNEAEAERRFFSAPDFEAAYAAPDGRSLSVKMREGSLLHLIDDEPVSERVFRNTLFAIPGDAWAFKVAGSAKEFVLRRPDPRPVMRANAKLIQQRANAAKMQELAAWNADVDAKRKAKKDAKRALAMPEVQK